MMQFLNNLVQCWPIVLALLAVVSANVRRKRRAYQALMPVVTVIYAGVAIYFFLWQGEMLEQVSQNIVNDAMRFVGRPPLKVDGPWLPIWENALVLTFFIPIKLAFRGIFTGLLAKGRFTSPWLVLGLYDYDPDKQRWFIDPKLARVRDLYRAMFWVSAVSMIILITLARTYPNWPGFVTFAFPALAVLVLGEIYFAINGLTEIEYQGTVLGERDSSQKVANFAPLRKVLREAFPERVMADDVQLSSTDALGSAARLKDMKDDEVLERRLAGHYFSRLKDARQDIDINLAEASADLMLGKSVVFMNPFFSDLTPYLSLPAFHELLQGRKVLIITGRDTIADDLCGWITEGLGDVSGVPGFWVAGILDERPNDQLDVGILRYADVHNSTLLDNHDEFLKDVGLVFIAEPSRMLATGQVGLPWMLTRCFRGRTPVFAAFDGNHDGLVDSLSHILKTSITEVIASSLPERINFEMIWRAEGSNMHAEIFPTIGRYLGVGTEIGAMALKYQVSKVYWVGGESFPVLDMHWIAEQYYAQIGKFADLELTQDAFRAVFKADADPWALPREDNYFIIVEDETRNVYETARRYATRATQASVVNVISDDYLMRDYMVDNQELFSADAKAVPAIVPDFARTERNAVLRVALSLTTFGITEVELQHELDLLGWTVAHEATDTSPRGLEWEPRVLTRLRKGLADHLVIDADALRFIVGPPQGLGISEERSSIIKVAPGSELDRAIDALRPAYFYVEDDKESTNFVGALLYGHVYQSMLPGQFVTYGGKYYEVERINPAGTEGGVVVRRAADHIHDRRSYRQTRTFEIADLRLSDSLGASVTVGGTSIRRCVANVRVHTHGYVESSSRSALGASRAVHMDDIPDRAYANTAVLEVRLPDIDPAVRRTVAVLLNELFVTIFPSAHQFIVAVTSDPDREVAGLLSHVQMEEDSDAIYIVEDSMMDLGLTIAVERNWDRLMEIITDYLAWNATPRPIVAEPKTPGREFVIPEVSGLAPAKKPSRLRRFINKLRPFKRKKKDPVGIPPEPIPSTPQEPSQKPVTELPPDPATQVMPEPAPEVASEVAPEPETSVDDETPPTDPITPETEVATPPAAEGGTDDVAK